MTDNCTGTGPLGLFMVTSELAVHPDGADDLSDDHRRSRARIPHAAARPALIAPHQYAVVAR